MSWLSININSNGTLFGSWLFHRWAPRLILLLLFSEQAQSQFVDSVTIGSRFKTYSKSLREERQYLVSLPSSYRQDDFYNGKRYPVMILLDADTHFRYASGIIQFMSAAETEQIPEMIVVAVVNTARTRDMTAGLQGQPDNFSTFLETELLPHIDQQYRTLPFRLLVGHSLAGLFAVNCFLNQRPFQAYIAIDPTLTWDRNSILRKAAPILAANQSLTARLFLTQANNPFEPGQHTGARGNAFDTFRSSLAGNQSKRLAHQYVFYRKENHYSVPFASLREGLLFIFEGYEFPFHTLLEQGRAGISRHYKGLADRLGIDLLPPGKVINQAALFLLNNQKQIDQAQGLLLLNQSYYPDSYMTHLSLGDLYKAKGDTVTAIQHYKQSLNLKKTNDKAKRALSELTKQ